MRLTISTFSAVAEIATLDASAPAWAGVLVAVAVAVASWCLETRPLVDHITGRKLRKCLFEGPASAAGESQ